MSEIIYYPCDEVLRDEVRALRDAPGSVWSNGKMATATRTNTSYVSQYLNEGGNLVKNCSASLEPRLRIWLRDLKLRTRNLIETIKCPIAEEIWTAVEFVYKTGGIGCVIGPAGIGKTRGLEFAVKKLSNFDSRKPGESDKATFACLIHVFEGKHTAKGLAAAIVEDGRAGRPSRGVSDAEHIFAALKGSTVPILVDDAHDLTTQAVKLLFRLREATGVPVVMAGTDKLLEKLRSDGQWLRRAGMKWPLTILNGKGELDERCVMPLIEHHIEKVCGPVNGEEEELIGLCEQIVGHAGHFGSLHEQLFLAGMLRKGQPDWTWCKAVRSAHTKLIREWQLS